MKNQKGITLIALIITIIVLVILVAVTVAVAMEGKIFQRSKEAAIEKEKHAIYETIVSKTHLDDNGEIIVQDTVNDAISELTSEGKTANDLGQGVIEVLGNTKVYFYYQVTTKKIIILDRSSNDEPQEEVVSVLTELERYMYGPDGKEGDGRLFYSETQTGAIFDAESYTFVEDTTDPTAATYRQVALAGEPEVNDDGNFIFRISYTPVCNSYVFNIEVSLDSETGDMYTVVNSLEMLGQKTGEHAKLADTSNLEKYLFGETKSGKLIYDKSANNGILNITNASNWNFVQDPEDPSSTEYQNVKFLYIDPYAMQIYFKYGNGIYKFNVTLGDGANFDEIWEYDSDDVMDNIYSVGGTLVLANRINENSKQANLDELRTYLFGQSNTGKPFISMGEEGFGIDALLYPTNLVERTMYIDGCFLKDQDNPDSTVYQDICYLAYRMGNGQHGNYKGESGYTEIYIKYCGDIYKFDVDMNETMSTIPNSLEYVGSLTGNVGKEVTYQGKQWIVLYDDNVNGVQLISKNALGSVSLDTSNFAEARDTYNTIESVLTQACKDETQINSNIRNVGNKEVSDPELTSGNTAVFANLDSEISEALSDTNLTSAITNYEGTTNGFLKGNIGDYTSDFIILKALGIVQAENKMPYWVSSRYISWGDSGEKRINFFSGAVSNEQCPTDWCTPISICRLDMEYENIKERNLDPSTSFGVRPVVTLTSSQASSLGLN